MHIQPPLSTLGPLRRELNRVLAAIEAEHALERIWERDYTLWKNGADQIVDRLGWLHSPETMAPRLPEIYALVDGVRAAGYTRALVLGMGGSSLAPEVLRSTFGVRPGYLDLRVLDSTDPDAVRSHAQNLDPATTLFIAATKSGSTVETLSFLKYFYQRTAVTVGAGAAGAHFVAITDPGSGLADLGAELGFHHIFLNDPEIGGRYSALSCFGLVGAALIGVDLERLLRRAAIAADTGSTTGLLLGAALGAGARCGRDKLTMVCSPAIAALGAWIEQLVAESTGKEGQGILPVDGEAPGPPEVYGKDRLFVYLRLRDDPIHDGAVESLAAAGQPLIRLDLEDPYDLGAAFFHWQMATSLAAHCLRVNPFDQPDVEAAKALARNMVDAYRRHGRLPAPEPVLHEGHVAVYSDAPAHLPWCGTGSFSHPLVRWERANLHRLAGLPQHRSRHRGRPPGSAPGPAQPHPAGHHPGLWAALSPLHRAAAQGRRGKGPVHPVHRRCARGRAYSRHAPRRRFEHQLRRPPGRPSPGRPPGPGGRRTPGSAHPPGPGRQCRAAAGAPCPSRMRWQEAIRAAILSANLE